jgi:hypothetical protein
VFADKPALNSSRWLIWETAQALGARPASIHEYYMAGGQGAWSNRATPAINIRGMTYDIARTIYRARKQLDVGQQIFEIARSEIGCTDQRPHEFASVVLAAAIREGVEGLAPEAMNTGFYNVDIDASTVVDLSLVGEQAQQRDDARRTAQIAARIRRRQPPGVTVSIGGETGEVGSENSTAPELRAFMARFNRFMNERSWREAVQDLGADRHEPLRPAASRREAWPTWPLTFRRSESCQRSHAKGSLWPAPSSTACRHCPARPSSCAPKRTLARSI